MLHFYRIGYHHGIVGFPGLFLSALSTQSFSLVSTGFNAISEAVYGALLKVKLITPLCSTRWTVRTFSQSLFFQPHKSKTPEINRQVFVRLFGSLGTLLSGCLVFALSGSPEGPAVQLMPAFIALVSGLGGIVLGIYVVR